MSDFFNVDGGIMTTLNKLFDLFIISIIYVICCIPIVTAGAATTALYYAVVKVIRHERGYVIREYFKSFKMNFKSATIIWIITLILTILFSFNIKFSRDYINGNMGFILMCVYLTFLFVILGIVVYIFPILSRFNMKVFQLVKTALLLSIKHLPITILIDAIVLLSAFLIYFRPITFTILPAVSCLLTSFLMERVLKKYMPKTSDNPNADEWYLE